MGIAKRFPEHQADAFSFLRIVNTINKSEGPGKYSYKNYHPCHDNAGLNYFHHTDAFHSKHHCKAHQKPFFTGLCINDSRK